MSVAHALGDTPFVRSVDGDVVGRREREGEAVDDGDLLAREDALGESVDERVREEHEVADGDLDVERVREEHAVEDKDGVLRPDDEGVLEVVTEEDVDRVSLLDEEGDGVGAGEFDEESDVE